MRDIDEDESTKRIRQLNDAFRDNLTRGRVVLTSGVQAFGHTQEIIDAMKAFSDFNDGNDPYREHDFGAFEVRSEKFFFKIDYFDLTLKAGSQNPADDDKTMRVMTLMLASEY